MRFARPIRWMVTLLNDNLLEIDLEDNSFKEVYVKNEQY